MNKKFKRGMFNSAAATLAPFLALVLFAFPLRAQEENSTPQPPVLSSNRFLFVFDVSHPMRRSVSEVITNAAKIFASAAGGELRNGDTIGVWKFNDKVSSDLPVIEWAPEDARQVSRQLGEYLKKQHYTGTSQLSVVMADLRPIVKASDVLTTIILCEGTGKMTGTPFDGPINDFLASHGKKGREEIPITIVLQSVRGKFTKYSMTANPWPVVFPELPPPPPAPAPVVKQIAAAPPPPVAKPKAVVPPLILIGPQSKPRREAAPAQKVEQAPAPTALMETTNQTAATPPAAMAVNPVSAAPAPPPAAQTAIVTAVAPSAVPTPSAATVVETNALAQTPVATPSEKKVSLPKNETASSPPPAETIPAGGSPVVLYAAIGLAVLSVILAGIVWLKYSSNSKASYITRSMSIRQKN